MKSRTEKHSILNPKCLNAVLGALVATSLMSCLTPGDETAVAEAAPAEITPDEGTVPSQEEALYFKVESSWYQLPDTKTTLANCTIPYGSAPMSINCSATVPEAQLFYSSLYFTFGTADSTTCRVVEFKPYYYQISDQAGYFPSYKATSARTTAVDCSASPISADCFNGVAKYLDGLSFPDRRWLFFISENRSERTTYTTSAFEHDVWSNKFSTNNLVAQGADITENFNGNAANGVYMQDTMQNYQVNCRNYWNELQYTIHFTMNDEDYEGAGTVPGGPVSGESPGGAGTNHFSDWN